MPTTTERGLARLRARFERRAQELARTGFLLKGSVLKVRRRCSSPGCGCQRDPDKLHGPYWQWTGKVGGKTTTRALTREQLRRYREWMDNSRRFEEIVTEIYALALEANELLRAEERQAPDAGERGPRRRTRS